MKLPRKRTNKPARPRITAEQRKDWRNLPPCDWNVLTFTEYFIGMNAELYGVEYAPLRNWRYEQGMLRRALDEHGPELLRAAFDECFRDYRPSAAYPVLTAGFCVGWRINSIIPRLKLEQAERERQAAADLKREDTSYDEVRAWL